MILVLGSVNVDLVIRSSRLPRPGETVVGGTFFQNGGGKGANQAVAAARAGASVMMIGAVGADAFGDQARRSLESEGIDCRYLRRLEQQPTGVALILVDQQGENSISVASGANACVTPELVEALPDTVWQSAQLLLACLEVPWDTVQLALQRARQFGLRTILNPAPVTDEFLETVQLDTVDVLTPNEHEASRLTDIEIQTPEDAVQAACALRQRGAQHILVTLGAAGALLVDHAVTSLPAVPVQVIDTTAAGDAFNGALAAQWARGNDLRAAARFATAAAACSVTCQGAQPSLPHRAEIEACLARLGDLSNDSSPGDPRRM